MKHIVNVSGGNASAECLFRVIERHGRENCVARYADTNSEHPDLYRFLDDLERVSGMKLVRLNQGMDIWDVFMKEAMLTTPKGGGCVASWRLKKLPLQEHAATIGTPETVTIHVGFSIDEDDRIARITESGKPWQFDFPLTWRPVLGHCEVRDSLIARGVQPCSMYEDGFPHANCGGGCILAGIKQWAGYYRINPAGYLRCEGKEAAFMDLLESRGRKPRTILKDRRGGETKNLSLRQLREELDSGVRKSDDSWMGSTCSCVGSLFD